MRSTAEKELQDVRDRFATMRRVFVDLVVQPEAVTETLEELNIEDDAMGSTVAAWLASAEDRRRAVLLALSEDRDRDLENCPVVDQMGGRVDAMVNELRGRVQTLRNGEGKDARVLLNAEADELRARNVLAEHEGMVLDGDRSEEKTGRLWAVHCRHPNASDHAEEQRHHEREVVTQKLRESFQNELSKLKFRDVEVELTDAGGAEGVLYHKIVLSRAAGVELPKVVSEGEQRCLSIAAFFAELSTAEDPSGIVFDDPVSSLDYRWRDSVARRLVEGSRNPPSRSVHARRGVPACTEGVRA